MDRRFHSVMAAALAGRLADFVTLLDETPDLVTARSSCSHPTLLQFVVLDGGQGKIAQPERFVRVLVDRGADLAEPLVAAASIGSKPMASFLLAAGAPVESGTPWTPLEESVYWAHHDLSSWLRSTHGARVLSLRAAAGLGDLEEMDRFLEGGRPTAGAGPVRFPWGASSTDPQDVLDQALVIAAKNGRSHAVQKLLARGADPGAFPPGVHEGGSALHLAAMSGQRETVIALIDGGADPSRPDPEHRSTPAGWAEHGGHPELAAFLRGMEIAAYNASQSEKHRALCDLLSAEIEGGLEAAEARIWHGHPVWFIDGNPIVGYSKQKRGIRLMFWSGADFDEPDLDVPGKTFKDASRFYNEAEEVDRAALARWLRKGEEIQWDYANVARRKGRLEKLK